MNVEKELRKHKLFKQIEEIRWLKAMIIAHIPSNSLIKNTNDILDRAIDTIETLSAKVRANNLHGGWIPCSERLPENLEELVLVQVSGNPCRNIFLEDAIEIASCVCEEGWIIEQYPEWESAFPVAWMPLPEPYTINEGVR